MELIDNRNKTLRQDLSQEIRQGSRLSVAAACFSIYAYEELRAELKKVDELRFVFTSSAFVKEKEDAGEREFYIARKSREKSLYGTAFEVKLRNELRQKAIAKECAQWLRKKAVFKSNITAEQMPGFLTVDDNTYMPFSEFTTVGLGCKRGDYLYQCTQKSTAYENTGYFLRVFDELWNDESKLADVTDTVIENIMEAYKENDPELVYFFTLYNIFSEFLKSVSEDELADEATGFKESKIWGMLYEFQKDAALAIISKLEKFNGCILADSVGLGKTFTALAVIKYYEARNKSVLVLCPKKLSANWNTYKSNYINNPIAEDRLRYDVLYHTDLSRTRGESNGIDLSRLKWGNYDLVVIDESHNFRNGSEAAGENGKENRYSRLVNQVIRAGVRTKVLMLSATPVNNKFTDLKNQLALAYEGDAAAINAKLHTHKTIDEIFRQSQKAFNEWCKRPAEQRTTDSLLQTLDFDFFELLDSVTIARSRRHIEKYYSVSDIGKFPRRLPPISLRPRLTDLSDAINYNEIYETLTALNLSIYTPSKYIMPSQLYKYADAVNSRGTGLTQQGREEGIRRLMSINLLKRLESSVYAFSLTLNRIRTLIDATITKIRQYQSGACEMDLTDLSEAADFDLDDQNTDLFSVGKKVKIDLADMDYLSWLHELEQDTENLELLDLMIRDITPQHDTKLQTLLDLIRQKLEHPLNANNRKVIVFTAFSDTADYLFQHVSSYVKQNFGLDTAEITGSVDGKTTIPRLRADLNTVLTLFSPLSKGKDVLMPDSPLALDVLIATDCISEGQNLQDCDYLVNYDIHWNPVRIVQRFGRIDRIGSKNDVIQLVNFWPDMDLDEYINLKNRVETRMRISIMTSTGDDDLINAEEKGDLEYRRAQLKRLQTEVVDIEDMSSGISIMDLGLNEFRMNLLEYMKTHDQLDKTPLGIHAVVPSTDDTPPGVIFVLKNGNESVNVDHRNRIHPFYMVYIGEDGRVLCDYLNPKKLLDALRYLCQGKNQPFAALCQQFNEKTKDGRDMRQISQLLSDAIDSIIDQKEDSDLDSLFSMGGTSALLSQVSGLDDFELISFVVVQ